MDTNKQEFKEKMNTLRTKYSSTKKDLDLIINDYFAVTTFQIEETDKIKLNIAYEEYKKKPYVKKSYLSHEKNDERNDGEIARSKLLNVLTGMLREYGIYTSELFDWDYNFETGVFTYKYDSGI